MTRPRVGVIGGGIFGASAAIELAGSCEVVLLEQGPELLMGATFANHNRHHYGYHYPRSVETARQCLDARDSFEDAYGAALVRDFDNFYCVAKEGSKTTAEAYVRFCDEVGLPYEEVWPHAGVVDRSRLAICLRVPEPVYDFEILRDLVGRRLRATRRVSALVQHRVTGGALTDAGTKRLAVQTPDGAEVIEVDLLVNATYSSYNAVCRWFGFPPRTFQFNLQELDVIRIPDVPRFGVTIQDGPFPSVLPLGRGDRYLLAHVVTSQLVREVSDEASGLLARVRNVVSEWESVLRVSSEYLPALRSAIYLRSIFADRVVDAGRAADDARITEITAHGSRCWSIFGAKVITAVATARALRTLVEAEL